MPSIELGHPIPEAWILRLEAQPEVVQAESYWYNFSYWNKTEGGAVTCCVIGSLMDKDALGCLRDLTADMREQLTEPGAVVVDESDADRLGLKKGIGETAEVSGHRVRIVGLVRGFRSIWGPYVFCSRRTARMLLPVYRGEQTQYLLARCRDGTTCAGLVERLRRQYPDMSVFPSQEFSLKTRFYWLTRTMVGISMGFTAVLGLLVGLLITSQTLYAATAASLREYAVLRALGIPRWRMSVMVLTQSFWIGVSGVAVALPAVVGLGQVVDRIGSKALLPNWLLASAAVLTMAIALLSGLAALRSLRMAEPITLLH